MDPIRFEPGDHLEEVSTGLYGVVVDVTDRQMVVEWFQGSARARRSVGHPGYWRALVTEGHLRYKQL